MQLYKASTQLSFYIFQLQARCQARAYSTEQTELSASLSQKILQDFSWRRISEEIKREMPLLYACLSGAVTRRKNEDLLLKL